MGKLHVIVAGMLPHIDSNVSHSCQVGWMSFGWLTILDTHWKLLSVNPISVAVLDTNRCAWFYYHTTCKGT